MSPWLIVAGVALAAAALLVWAFWTAPVLPDDYIGEITRDDF